MDKDGILRYDQGAGASMRLIAEVEPTWSNVFGLVPPGISGYFLSSHYSDGFYMWLKGDYSKWEFKQSTIESTYSVAAEYRRQK